MTRARSIEQLKEALKDYRCGANSAFFITPEEAKILLDELEE